MVLHVPFGPFFELGLFLLEPINPFAGGDVQQLAADTEDAIAELSAIAIAGLFSPLDAALDRTLGGEGERDGEDCPAEGRYLRLHTLEDLHLYLWVRSAGKDASFYSWLGLDTHPASPTSVISVPWQPPSCDARTLAL